MAVFKLLFCVALVAMINNARCVPHHTADSPIRTIMTIQTYVQKFEMTGSVAAKKIKDHSNHCHASGESETLHIEVGESASLPGKCQKVTCEKDFTLSALTCAAHPPKDGCKLSDIDYKKPYPDCCPQDICDSKQ